jgi:hypothetical protein
VRVTITGAEGNCLKVEPAAAIEPPRALDQSS